MDGHSWNNVKYHTEDANYQRDKENEKIQVQVTQNLLVQFEKIIYCCWNWDVIYDDYLYKVNVWLFFF